jgi:hypothetical protein
MSERVSPSSWISVETPGWPLPGFVNVKMTKLSNFTELLGQQRAPLRHAGIIPRCVTAS